MNAGKNKKENDSSSDDCDAEEDKQDAVDYSSC